MTVDRKGLSNSVYAVVTLTALIAGLMLLSNFGNPYSLAGQSGSTEVDNLLDDQDKLDISKETASKASKYINSEDIDTRSIKQNKQLMKLLAEQLSGLIKGSQKNSRSREIGANRTMNPGNISGSANQTQKTNEEFPDTNESSEKAQNSSEVDKGNESDQTSSGENEESKEANGDTRENNSETDGENGDKTGQNDGDSQNNEIYNSTGEGGYEEGKKQNATEGLREKLESSRNSSKSLEKENNQSNGFLRELIKSIMSGFESGSENKEKVSKEKTSEQQDQETQLGKSQSPQESSKKLNGSGNLKYLAILTAIPLIALLALMYYRSDKNRAEILKIVIERFKNFVVSLPDLFRRSVVEGVSFILSRIKKLLKFTTRMLKQPVKTLKTILSSLRSKVARTAEVIEDVRKRSLRENIDVLLEKEQQIYQGLDKLWMMLKKMAEIENKGTLTPEEVKKKAVNKGMSEETVEKVVSAYRKKKYSSEKDVEEEVDVQELKQELEEGGDE